MAGQIAKSQLEIEAWDKYAAAALAGIASRSPADCEAVAEEAALYADSMLERRRIKLKKLQDANSIF